LPEITGTDDRQNRTAGDDDAGFVARCQQGRTEEFAVLVRRHQKKMLNIAYRMIGDYDEACDVVQEAFLSAYRAIGQFRGEARFSTWLTGIVVNRVRDHLSRKIARTRREEVLDDDPAEPDGRRHANVLFEGDDPADIRIEKRERDAHIQKCIDRLDGEQKEVLVLRDIQDYSYEEIGAMLNLPPGTVRSRLFRARSALKASLQKVLGDLL
jgi:RNA polymerase sigma-70 factor (ECF subfamily)